MCDFTEYNSPLMRLANYHYCNCFVKDGYEALWMSNSFNLLTYVINPQGYRFRKSLSAVKRHRLGENVYGFAPYSWRLYGNYPFFNDPRVLLRFEKYVRPDIRESLKKIGFLEVDVLWLSNPKTYWLMNVVKYDKLVYRIADDYRQFPEHFPNIGAVEDEVVKRADVIILSSESIAQRVRDQGKSALFLSNGVEYEHFSNNAGECPPEYMNKEGKRIVYIGAIHYWFDVELVNKLAEQVDADIFLIGKVETDLSRLKDLNNVHVLGPRNYEKLPAYLHHADVAIIPFIKTTMTDSISPIKLFEYCSSGIGVVSSNMRETANLKAPICIADSHEEFIEGVKHYLVPGYDRSVLQEYGKRNSWESRFKQIKELL